MNGLEAVAARALARGDALGAMKLLGARSDPPARALRAVALAQMGDYVNARAHARAVLRARGVDAALRARCLAVDAEIALATGDARWDAAPVSRAIAELRRIGDDGNAGYLQLVAARAALRLGRPDDAAHLLAAAAFVPAAAVPRAMAALVRVDLAAKRRDAPGLLAAVDAARVAARDAGIAALKAEVERVANDYEGPSVVITSGGAARTGTFLDACLLAPAGLIVVDGGVREVRFGAARVDLARKPMLFALLRALVEAAPASIPRDALMVRAFGVRQPNASHRSRLRVEIGRLRKIARAFASIEASDDGYALGAAVAVALVMPLEESEATRALALMQRGEPWTAVDLSVALDVSARTVQRTLASLEVEGRVAAQGLGRARKWVRLGEIPTDLLLPGRARVT